MNQIPKTREIIGKILKEDKYSIDFEITEENEYTDKRTIKIPTFYIFKREKIAKDKLKLTIPDWLVYKKTSYSNLNSHKE